MSHKGTVKFFNGDKGWGLIDPDGGGPDLHVHFTDLHLPGQHRLVEEGQRVSFDISQGQRGPQAINVKLIH